MTLFGDAARTCGFPAIYNFGDSNSDTGGISAALNAIQPPNGETFFGHPSGRACDGRLIIDFIGNFPIFSLVSLFLKIVHKLLCILSQETLNS